MRTRCRIAFEDGQLRDLLWAGTSNGLVQLTRDRGKTWVNVSPPRLSADPALTLWSLEASPHDPAVAYAAAIDLSDRRGPCIFRTSELPSLRLLG